MISHGLTNAAISEKLCLSPKTVSTYRLRLLDKLGAKNEVDLAFTRAERRGLAYENAFGGATSFLRRRYSRFRALGVFDEN